LFRDDLGVPWWLTGRCGCAHRRAVSGRHAVDS